MDEHNIDPMEAILPFHKAPGNYSEGLLTVKSNLYGLRLPETKPKIYRYYIEIKIATAELTEGSPSEASSNIGEDSRHSGENGNGNGHGSNESGEENGNGNTTNGVTHDSNGSSDAESPKEVRISGLINLTKARIRGDASVIYRRACFRKVWNEMLARNGEVFPGDKHRYYFDLEQTVYALDALNFIDSERTVGKRIIMETGPNFFPEAVKVDVTLKRAGHVVLGKYDPGVNLDLTAINNEMMQFLEIVTSQAALFNPDEHIVFAAGKSYLLAPEHYTFTKQDIVDLPEGTYVGLGSHKSVRYVEGPRGRMYNNAAVLVESKKTPFHSPQSLADKAYLLGIVDDECRPKRQYDSKHFNKCLAGLYVLNALSNGNRNGNGDMTFREPFYKVHGIDLTLTPETHRFNFRHDGEEQFVSVLEYYRDYKQVELQFPHSPLVLIKIGAFKTARTLHFPMEMLIVVDNQRVTTEKQSNELISKLIRACAIPPSKMAEQIGKHVKALQLSDPISPFLQQAQISVISRPLTVNARLLAHPTILYEHDMAQQVNNRGSWDVKVNTHFIIPASCNSWAVTYITDGSGQHFFNNQMNTLRELTNQMSTLANSRGMKLAAPLDIRQIPNTFEALDGRFKVLKQHNVEFAFFVTYERVKNMHDNMKLLECQYEIVTQDLNSKTMDNVVGKRQRLTLENVLMKTNMKLGGLNHSIRIDRQEFQQLLNPRTLYIGFGMNHPAGGMLSLPTTAPELEEAAKKRAAEEKKTEEQKKYLKKPIGPPPPPPSVVGLAANDGVHPFEFTGDYVYQPARRDEKVAILSRSRDESRPLLQDVVETIITRFQKNRKFLPEKIVIYRNGCSEGQFANVLVYEVPLIKAAMKNMGCNDTKLTFIVPNKLHSMRLYPAEIDPNAVKAPEQNIKPGFVVDTGVVHPTMDEFYLCSHTTLQGTAKVPRYTVIFTDDKDLTADHVQEMTYALAYGHQIVRSPTSIPSPVYIAGHYAERGRKVVNAFMSTDTTYNEIHEYYRGHIQRTNNVDRYAAWKQDISEEQQAKINLFNSKITLHNHETLRRRRINA
uniref:Piwi domain-containing protein n=1 Tax=Acrobeloides nanus TaxID=290746 RepID=A0A914DM11_9BILA